MTDNEIIKALECCKNDDCDNCPNTFGNCYANLAGYALDLIERQQAEIDRLTTENERVKTKIYKMAIDKALAEKASAEAIKEFEEKLNSGFFRGHIYTGSYVLGLIEAIAKGMVGEGNA